MRIFILVLTMALLNFGLATAATTRFTDNGDGTVTDNVTTLIWQQCSNGQTADATCSGTATAVTWEGAITYCEGLTNVGTTSYTDWRLPNIKELASIVDDTAGSAPAIDATYFPATVSSEYWSATTLARISTFAWNVYFANGTVNYNVSKSLSISVRCVR